MNNPIVEVMIILLLLAANGVFAMSEIAIVSARKARLQGLVDSGNTRARIALELSSDPGRFLATIQIGITLIGILAGAFGGATIAKTIAIWLRQVALVAPYSEAIGVGIVVLCTTYLALVIGELLPKRIALNNPEKVAVAVAAPMRGLSRLASPLVRLLIESTNLVTRLLRIKPSVELPVTEDELKVLIEQGTQVGVFEESEQDMLESVLRLDERRVSVVMTPRSQVVWLDPQDSPEEVKSKITLSRYSSFPVARDDLDNVLGVVRAKDLLARCLADNSLDLEGSLLTPLFVPESASVLRVLELFKNTKTHIALVTDEFGGIEGIVTHNDVMESIVGDLPSDDELAQPQAVLREDGSWLLDGALHIDQLKEIFDIESLPGEEYGHYQTVGGFVMSQMRDIPSAGQYFEWERVRFEIMDMDGRRVDKVLAVLVQPDLPEQPHKREGL
jgi:putative hemolysin